MSDLSRPLRNGAETPYDYHVKQELLAREYQVAIEKMIIVKERLAKCARTEHINQFTNCKELRDQYVALLKDRYHGMVFPPELEPPSRLVPGVFTADKTKQISFIYVW